MMSLRAGLYKDSSMDDSLVERERHNQNKAQWMNALPLGKVGGHYFTEVDMKLILLSAAFYAEYSGCPEILQKQTRPYVCLEIEIDGITFAIPFRHSITHKWAFFTQNNCGLDYTKAIVLSEQRFIGSQNARVDQAEFNRIKGKEHIIASGMRRFLNTYRKALRYPENPHYKNILTNTALQYFHGELGIADLK